MAFINHLLFLLYKCYITALGIKLLSFKHKPVQLLLLLTAPQQALFPSPSDINLNFIKAQTVTPVLQ